MEILSNLFNYILLENEIKFLLEYDTNSEKRNNALSKIVAMGEYLKPGANGSEGEIENGYQLSMNMIKKYNFTKQELVNGGLRREAFLFFFGNREIKQLKKEKENTTDENEIKSIEEKIKKIKTELTAEVNKYYPTKSDYNSSSYSSSSRGGSRSRSNWYDDFYSWNNDYYNKERERKRKEREQQEKRKREQEKQQKKSTTYEDLLSDYKLLELFINDNDFIKKVLYVVENSRRYDEEYILDLLIRKSNFAISPKIAYLILLKNIDLIEYPRYGEYLIKALKLSRQLLNDLIKKYPELKKFF